MSPVGSAVLIAFSACAFAVLAARADGAQSSPAPVASSPAASSATAATSATGAPSAGSGRLNIAFDQIDRIIKGAGTPPPLNHFNDDLAAIARHESASGISGGQIASQVVSSFVQQAISMINPIAGFISGFAAQAQANAARKRQEEQMKAMYGPNPGTFTRYYFYNGWMRLDSGSLVLIAKPEQRMTIQINTAKKTYRIEKTEPAPPQSDSVETPTPNAAKADLAVSTQQTDSASIAGQSAVGYKTLATITLTSSEDPCHDGNFTASQVEYVTPLAEPLVQAAVDAQSFYSLALPDDCNVLMSPRLDGVQLPVGQMYVYRLLTVVRDPALAAKATPAPSGDQPDPSAMMDSMFGANNGPPSNYMKLSERSNFRQLSAADAELFEIPAGFTETK
jgi:hypothetical protein